MRLRTFESFWLIKNGLLYSYPTVNKNISTEILVIGGGITGALTSYALQKAGYKVVLLDAGDIGQGSTSATTAMLQYEIDVPLYELAEMIGEKEAATCYAAGIQAIKQLASLVHDEKIACGFEEKASLYLAHNNKASKWLKKEYEMRNKYNLGVSWLIESEVLDNYGLKGRGAILSDTAASVDAYKLAHELIKISASRGMQVYDQAPIDKISYGKNGVQVFMKESDHVLDAEKIIFCTGFETVKMFKENIAELFSTFAAISEQGITVPDGLKHTLVWNTDDPYLYMRTTDDGRLLVGGCDTKHNSGFFREMQKKKKAKQLMKQLQRHLPEVEFIQDFNWAGVFGSTKDGLPYIGAHPDYDHSFFVLGFGGNGITFSVQAMEMAKAWLSGSPHPLQGYYKFGR